MDQGIQDAGEHTLNLNTQNWESGTYFYTLQIGSSQTTKQMIKVN